MPPEETSSKPSSARPRANVSMPVLVVDGDQRPHRAAPSSMPATISGSSRCSTAWIRSSSVSRGSTGTASCRRTRTGVEALVDEVDRDAGRLDARRERVVDRVRARERREQRGVDVHDAVREAREKRRREQMHVAGEHDRARRRAPRARSPSRDRAPRGSTWQSSAEGGGRDPCGACTNESVGVLPVGGDRSDRQARVDQRLQVRAVPGDEDADHAIRPITSSPGAGSATTAHQPIPRLKTRRSSSSATWRASQPNTGGRGQESQSISACVPVGENAAQVAEDPAAGDVREGLRAAAQRARLVEVEPGRGEQVGPVVVLGLEHPPDEREPVRVHAGRGEADHRVAGDDGRARRRARRGRRCRRTCRRSRARRRGRSRAARPSRRRRARRRPRGRPRRLLRRAPRPGRGRSPPPRRSRAASAAWRRSSGRR